MNLDNNESDKSAEIITIRANTHQRSMKCNYKVCNTMSVCYWKGENLRESEKNEENERL